MSSRYGLDQPSAMQIVVSMPCSVCVLDQFITSSFFSIYTIINKNMTGHDLEGHCLTQDEHSLFRTLTKLLADLDNHKKRTSYRSRRYSKEPMKKARKEKGRKIYEACQEPHVNLLVRDYEKPMIVIGPTIPGKPGTGSIIFLNRIASCTDANTCHENQEHTELEWKDVTARALDTARLSDSAEIDPIGVAIQGRIDADNSESSMPFYQHVEHYMQLLRNCHRADKVSSTDLSRQTVMDTNSHPEFIRNSNRKATDLRLHQQLSHNDQTAPYSRPKRSNEQKLLRDLDMSPTGHTAAAPRPRSTARVRRHTPDRKAVSVL